MSEFQTEAYLPGMAPATEPTQESLALKVPSQDGEVLCLKAQVRMTRAEALLAVLGNNANNADRTCIDTCPNRCFE